MGMTSVGIIRQQYSIKVQPRPFSRFTQVEKEIVANEAWTVKAQEWSKNKIMPVKGI